MEIESPCKALLIYIALFEAMKSEDNIELFYYPEHISNISKEIDKLGRKLSKCPVKLNKQISLRPLNRNHNNINMFTYVHNKYRGDYGDRMAGEWGPSVWLQTAIIITITTISVGLLESIGKDIWITFKKHINKTLGNIYKINKEFDNHELENIIHLIIIYKYNFIQIEYELNLYIEDNDNMCLIVDEFIDNTLKNIFNINNRLNNGSKIIISQNITRHNLESEIFISDLNDSDS
jgi:hypothetical protein